MPTEPADPATPAELRSAPTTVDAGGKRLTLTTSLWRDFMPISPPDGKPLVAMARVKTLDGSAVPESVRATQLWVVFNNEVWAATPREEKERPSMGPDYEVVAREGPKWGPNVTVDVVVRLTDGSRTWLLRAADQKITATF